MFSRFVQVAPSADVLHGTFDVVLAACSMRLQQFVNTIDRDAQPAEALHQPVGDLISRMIQPEGLLLGQVQRQFGIAPEDIVRGQPCGASTGASLGLEASATGTETRGGAPGGQHVIVTGSVVGPSHTCCGRYVDLPKNLSLFLDPKTGQVQFKYDSPLQLGLLLATIVCSNRNPDGPCGELSPIMLDAVEEIEHHPAFNFYQPHTASAAQPLW